MEIMSSCIPVSTRCNVPWMNRTIRNKIRRRNRLYKQARLSGEQVIMNKYKALRNELVSLLRLSKRKYIRNISLSRKKKKYWRAIKFLQKKSSQIPTLKDGNSLASSGLEKASLLNRVLIKNYNTKVPELSTQDVSSFSSNLPVNEFLCTEEDVVDLISILDTSKASGPDGISAKMLKGVRHSIAPHLTALFNKSIALGQIPQCWKTSMVVPIPKTTSELNKPGNYRPILLLSVVSKMLEKHIFRIVQQHVFEEELMPQTQWGFPPGRTTVTALLCTFHDVIRHLEQGKDVAMVFFDLRKAFDSVPHLPLLEKLRNLGLSECILEWIASYLYNRKQRVVVEGASSDIATVPSGVPQGSILGVLTLHQGYSKPATSKLVLYADDILLYKPITNVEEYAELQLDIDLINDRTRSLSMKQNVSTLLLQGEECYSNQTNVFSLVQNQWRRYRAIVTWV